MIAHLVRIEQGTAILFGMAMAILALCLLIAVLADEIVRLRADRIEDVEDDHAACIAHIADVTSRRVIATAMRDLAVRYDQSDGQRELRDIRGGEWTKDGPSIPALWMMHHADLLDPPAPNDGFVMLNGEHA